MRIIAIAVILPSALWFHTNVAAQSDPMGCLNLRVDRADDLINTEGQRVPAAIVAVTSECASRVGSVVVECAWTGARSVNARSTTLSDLGPAQTAIALATSEKSEEVPPGTKPECRISRAY